MVIRLSGAMQNSGSPDRIDGIQILRALAAILVLLNHTINFNEARSSDMPLGWLAQTGAINNFGACGVDLFFVLSGFIMAHLLDKPGAMSASMFLKRRFIRVIPYFWLISATYIFVMTIFGQSFTVGQWIGSVTIFPLGNPGHYETPALFVGWSLAFELSFYGVAALAVAIGRTSQARTALLSASVSVCALIGLYVAPTHDLIAIPFNAIWLEFMFGIIVQMLWRDHAGRMGTRAATMLIFSGSAVMAASALFGYPFQVEAKAVVNGESGALRSLLWGLPSATLTLGVIVHSAKANAGHYYDLVRNWLIHLGDASYSLYLTHMILLMSAQYLLPGMPGMSDIIILLLMAGCVQFALLVYDYLERPMLSAMGSRFFSRSPIAMPVV